MKKHVIEPMKFIRLTLVTAYLLIPSLGLWADSSSSEPRSLDSPLALETDYTRIIYQTPTCLTQLDQKLLFKQTEPVSGSMMCMETGDPLEKKLIQKIDTLFLQVQAILDMPAPDKKVSIHIYHDSDQLAEAYFQAYQKEAALPAWYDHDTQTISMDLTQLRAGILAHEMAHAVIDHFFGVKPPAAAAEILAQYVDAHIHPPRN